MFSKFLTNDCFGLCLAPIVLFLNNTIYKAQNDLQKNSLLTQASLKTPLSLHNA